MIYNNRQVIQINIMSEMIETIAEEDRSEEQRAVGKEGGKEMGKDEAVEKAEEKQEADFDDFAEAEETREEVTTENDFERYDEKDQEKPRENESNIDNRQVVGLKDNMQQHSQEPENKERKIDQREVDKDMEEKHDKVEQKEVQTEMTMQAKAANHQKPQVEGQLAEGQKTISNPAQAQPSSQKVQIEQSKVSVSADKQPDKQVSQAQSDKPIPSEAIEQTNHSAIIKQAQSQRIGSIYQQFINYNSLLQKTITSYKIIVNNVTSELIAKKDYKKHLQSSLVSYFEEYSKIHRQFHIKASKLPKEEEPASINKFVNIKQELRKGYDELFYLRRHIGVDAHKLDSYINTYIIKSIKQIFQDYRQEIAEAERKQLQPKDQFFKQDKKFKKIVENLDKNCKKGREGLKYKADVFVELVRFAQEEQVFKQALVAFGKTTLDFRTSFILAEKKLFEKLTKVVNEFKNEQKIVYTAAKQFNFMDDYSDAIQESTKFQRLCTITDIDYIKGVLELSNRKQKIQFTNKHFQEYLQFPFFQRIVGTSKTLFKGAMTKSFPLRKKNHMLIHTISHYLVEFDKQKSECLEVYDLKQLNAKIVSEALVQLQLVTGLIFKETKSKRVELQDGDRAHELIGYLSEIQGIQERGIQQKD